MPLRDALAARGNQNAHSPAHAVCLRKPVQITRLIIETVKKPVQAIIPSAITFTISDTD